LRVKRDGPSEEIDPTKDGRDDFRGVIHKRGKEKEKEIF